MRLDFRGKSLTANIEDAPLKVVLHKIESQKKIWFETGFIRDESLLDEEISVRFKGLSVQDGLERILSGVNHCLVFEQDSIVGVMLFGKPGKRVHRRSRGRMRPRRTIRRRR